MLESETRLEAMGVGDELPRYQMPHYSLCLSIVKL